MATAMFLPGSTACTLSFEDHGLYSNLSTEEHLIQLVIERSLRDAHNSAPIADIGGRTHSEQSRSSPPARRTNPPSQPNPAVIQPYHSSHNPPTVHPNDEIMSRSFGTTVSHFIMGNGKRMVAYHRYDGTLQLAPEPAEEEEPMFYAIKTGDVNTVRTMAKLPGINLMLPKKPGWLPLHEAAYFCQEKCLRILLDAQPEMINECTAKDQTALMLAVRQDSPACVEVLLNRGADPDIVNKDQETALYKACERDNAEIGALLLNHGALVNKPSVQGWTALHEAVCHNNVEICEMLVKAGAKIGATNIYGITPLFTAAQTGCVETLRFLIKQGADVNSQAGDGATALYEAAKNGHEEIVELLLSENADANKAGKTGLLPLHIAAQNGTDAKSLLTYECFNYDKSINIVAMLIPATSKARVRRSGISPLHLASESSRDEVLEVLIAAGFDVNAQLSAEHSQMYEDRRRTALFFAVIENNIDATTMLLNAGADPNLDPFSPLLVAVRQGCIKTVSLLVEHGANVNAYIPTHPTSFPATIMFGMNAPPLMQYLMDNGCDALSCFSCMYGSNPHPPIKTTHSEWGGMCNSANNYVQFCEMISNPLILCWVGPIINILLDYVGEVPFCARLIEHLDSLPDWEVIKEKAVPPRPLMQLCRLKIRHQVGIHRLRWIPTLPLPGRLIQYLNHAKYPCI